MFNFLKKMFGKDGAATATAEADPIPAPAAPVAKVVEKPVGGGVEVANLSLRAILEKLSPDLKGLVNQLPGPEVTIVLPVNTIVKQLATGAVRMSLASLLRQAPQGTFRKGPVEDKQMVDVPLSEIFKSVDAKRLGRRSDQRRYDVPDDADGLFGRDGAFRSVSDATAGPTDLPKSEPAGSAIRPAPEVAPAVTPAKVVRMPGIAPAASSAPAGGSAQPRIPAPAPSAGPTSQAHAESAKSGQVVLSFVELAAGWPEGIRAELTSLSGDTKLVIPANVVSPGLQKGKVVFPWSQVSRWIKPALSAAVSIPEDFEIVFPLRIIAPAFVAATGASKRHEGAAIDETLPDFFGPTSGQMKKAAAAAPAPAVVPEPVQAEAPVPAPAPAETASPALKLSLVCEEATPVEMAVAPVEQPAAEPLSPAEIVLRACQLPGVAGAVIGLEEGLVVAQKLPEGFSTDSFAAFMPQIFGRLERYTSEMHLGDPTEITIQSAQGPCLIARLGKIYFGVIGRAGEKLPEGLGLLSKQLAAHIR
jgi:predicted regulator of Ras-like GTPase activity (Roadblock/LC7/MglB family)